MFYRIFEALDKQVCFERARAHCDIPCGIYDPIVAQIAALTVVRMVDLAKDLESKTSDKNLAFANSLARYVAVKEEHAEKTKHEIRIIWGDYIKAQHLEKYPQIHGIVHEIMALGSKSRQSMDREIAVNLVEKVNEFAQIFWETKGIDTKRAKAPYAPGLELVYPNL